jgi:DNA polymerase III epsilon subunit-like protein
MQVQPDFLVIDTEGKNELSEIAIIGSQEHPSNEERVVKIKPLREIVADFLSLSQGKLLVFHHAEHDIRVLKKSFRKARITWKKPQFQCNYKLARYHFPNLSSYSLEYLSKYLNLKANDKYFDGYLAHTARYDAEFTYQVYC